MQLNAKINPIGPVIFTKLTNEHVWYLLIGPNKKTSIHCLLVWVANKKYRKEIAKWKKNYTKRFATVIMQIYVLQRRFNDELWWYQKKVYTTVLKKAHEIFLYPE